MELRNYCNQIKELHNLLLSYIDNGNAINDGFQELIDFIQDKNISENSDKLQHLLQLISKITKNHNHDSCFFNKIENIFLQLENKIKYSFSSIEMYKIFKGQKRILLFLFNHKFINIDQSIFTLLRYNRSNLYYFYPEIEPFLSKREKKFFENKLDFDTFEEKRKLGENDSYLCTLIRNDLIKEFIIYVNQTNLSLSKKTIKPSIFETNNFLLKKEPTIIEYAAFYGSIEIFKYLLFNNAVLKSSLWSYVIHGRNAELIHQLEELNIAPKKEILKESIKCHHNEIANYIQNNLVGDKFDPDDYNDNISSYCFHYYNFSFLENNFKFKFAFHYSCEFGHYQLVKLFIKEGIIKNINSKVEIKKHCISKVSALHLAAKNDHTKIIDFLLSQPNIQIEQDTFSGCKKLTQISIPSSFTEIDDKWFYNCISLSNVYISDSVRLIGNSAFEGCKSLEKISIPSFVTKIGDTAFADCSLLSRISLPSLLKEIGKGAFDGCSKLKEISIPSSLTLINDSAFRRCSLLKSIVIPQSVTEIGRYTFNGCLSLEKIEIPSSVKKIGCFAFFGCCLLKQIKMPVSLNSKNFGIDHNVKIVPF